MKLHFLTFALLSALALPAFGQSYDCESTADEPLTVDEQAACTAIGVGAKAGIEGTAIGPNSTAVSGVAVGVESNASNGVAIGNRAWTQNGVAVGNNTYSYHSVVIGDNAYGQGAASNAGIQSTVVGQGARGITPFYATQGAVALGDGTVADGDGNLAVGSAAEAKPAAGADPSEVISDATAIGTRAKANHSNSVVLGADSESNNNDQVSVGNATLKRQIVNVAAGIADNDAVIVEQLKPFAEALGGNANVIGGVLQMPSYNFINGAVYNNVGSALYDLDGRLYNLETNPPGQGPAGADGRSAYEVAVSNGFQGNESEWLESLQGANGQDGQDGIGGGSEVVAGENIEVTANEDGTQTVGVADNIKLSDEGSLQVGGTTVNGNGVTIEGGPSMTRDGIDAGNQRVTSVAPGRIEQGSTDAVNGGQIWELDDRWNDRFEHTDKRIDGLGAQLGAMTNMVGAAAAGGGGRIGEVQLNAGIGFSGNQAALAIGWSSRLSPRVSISGGVSFGTGNKPVAGMGISVNLGR